MNTTYSKTNWMINRRDDLLWLIYPSILGFLIIGLYYALTLYFGISENTAVIVIYLSWALLFDGTHAFATYSRTYFDREYYNENKGMLLKSLLVFVIGPVFILAAYFVGDHINHASTAFIVFNRFAICYAYYHLIRQHWGFVIIYRKKNAEPDDITRKLDGLLLAFGTIFPFVHGQINDIKLIHISETLPLSMVDWTNQGTYLLIAGLGIFALSFIKPLKFRTIGLHVVSAIMVIASVIIFSVNQFSLPKLLFIASGIVLTGFVITALYYIYLIIKGNNNPGNNLPKWLLMLTVIISYNIAFHLDIPILILIAAITVFHNIQYHKIVHFHNVNKYKPDERQRFGYAVVLAQKLGVFIFLALLFNLFSYIPRVASNILIENLLINYTLSAFFWGVAFHHYYLDSVIWKFRGNKKLNNDLKLK